MIYQEDLAYIQAAGFGALARGAAPEILRLLNNAAIEIRRVVDVGCGAGPLTAALVKAGSEATGIDNSAELLAIARTAVPQARFIHKSIYDVEIPACEAILAVGEPLTYHAEDANADTLVNGFLERASEVLPAGGMLIFDVIELGEPSLTGRVWSSGDDWAVLVDTKENQDSRTLVRNIETFRRVDRFYRRGREVHSGTAFRRPYTLQSNPGLRVCRGNGTGVRRTTSRPQAARVFLHSPLEHFHRYCVGQDGILRRIGNPLGLRTGIDQADCQSAAD